MISCSIFPECLLVVLSANHLDEKQRLYKHSFHILQLKKENQARNGESYPKIAPPYSVLFDWLILKPRYIRFTLYLSVGIVGTNKQPLLL